MSPATRRVGRLGWRRWSGLDQVEVVTLYTRGSLLFVLAVTSALVLAAGAAELDGGTHVAPLLVGGGLVAVAGLWAISAMVDHYPAVRPLPAAPMATLLAVSAVYTVLAFATFPTEARTGALTTVVVAAALSLGVAPNNRITLVLLAGAGVLAALRNPTPETISGGVFVAGAFVATSRLSMWIVGIVRDLDEARRAHGELAVMEERLRFSRDVHDVLGRRLSTIAVQAELAATLAQRGDDRAPERMLEVREVAHQALREARELARGYRATHFGQELEGARSLLRSAGIAVQLGVEDVPHAWQEPAAWVVRESVTNVLRHSRATTVAITWSEACLRIDNDGARAGETGDGAGLRGLRERLAPLGASLAAGPTPDDGWSVVAEFPGHGPLSARAGREPTA